MKSQNVHSLKTLTMIRVLVVLLISILSWSNHIKERLCKANKLLDCLRCNVAYRLKIVVNLCLYKSIIVPIVSYGLTDAHVTRGSIGNIGPLHKEFVVVIDVVVVVVDS